MVLRNGRPFCEEEEARTNPARILDFDKLQVAVFQQVNLIDSFGVVVAKAWEETLATLLAETLEDALGGSAHR